MSFISKNIDSLLLMDWQTISLLAVLCALAAFFIKDYLANPLTGYIHLSRAFVLLHPGAVCIHTSLSCILPRSSTNG